MCICVIHRTVLYNRHKKKQQHSECAKWIGRPPRHTPVEHLPGQCVCYNAYGINAFACRLLPTQNEHTKHTEHHIYTLGTYYHRAHVALRCKYYTHSTAHSDDVVCGPYTKEKKNV